MLCMLLEQVEGESVACFCLSLLIVGRVHSEFLLSVNSRSCLPPPTYVHSARKRQCYSDIFRWANIERCLSSTQKRSWFEDGLLPTVYFVYQLLPTVYFAYWCLLRTFRVSVANLYTYPWLGVRLFCAQTVTTDKQVTLVTLNQPFLRRVRKLCRYRIDHELHIKPQCKPNIGLDDAHITCSSSMSVISNWSTSHATHTHCCTRKPKSKQTYEKGISAQ